MASTKFLRLSANNLNWSSGAAAFGVALDATNDGIAFVFQARDANAITHLGFRYSGRTGTPPTYVIALETPSATTGVPDGTVLGGGTPASATFTPPADTTWDSTWQWVALSNSYTPTVGQLMCITIRYSSGTVDASNYSTITRQWDSLSTGNLTTFPYPVTLSGGAWTKIDRCAPFGIRTASTRYGQIMQSSWTTGTASTVGHRQAMRFTVPSNVTNTFTVRGARFYGLVAQAGGKNPIFGLWSSSSVIQNVTIDSDLHGTSARYHEILFDEASLTALSPGTTYYIGLEVADAVSGSLYMTSAVIAAADDGDAYPGGANDWCASDYDGISWTDAPTRRPFMELILDDMTQQSGGSGGYVIGGN